jgi:hypothetical protein
MASPRAFPWAWFVIGSCAVILVLMTLMARYESHHVGSDTYEITDTWTGEKQLQHGDDWALASTP